MTLTIIAPQGTIFSGEVARFQFPSTTGLMEFLPGHAPMIAELRPGVITTDKGEMAGGCGVVKIENDIITAVVNRYEKHAEPTEP